MEQGRRESGADCHNENTESVEGVEDHTEDCAERLWEGSSLSPTGAHRNVRGGSKKHRCLLEWASLDGREMQLGLSPGSPTIELNDLPRTTLAFKILLHAF